MAKRISNEVKRRTISALLDIPSECRRYGLGLWQCPPFLFLVMGLIIVVTVSASYLIGTKYFADPSVVALLALGVTSVLFTIDFIIIRSFEKLAEASRMKSEFINIASHQLRAPITNLKWGIDFLASDRAKDSPQKRKEYLVIIKENIRRMVELVDDLLIVSKIEQGTFPTRKKEIALEDLIKELIVRFRLFAEARNIKLTFLHQENLPKVFVDPSQMKLVIENLLDNAIRYSQGRSKVVIELLQEGKKLSLTVRDSGVGIPEKDQKYIFQKFFRTENALRKETEGSGLGLYIVKSIIQKAGGTIRFESQEGHGTTFYLTLSIK